jgi:hypothetical protein
MMVLLHSSNNGLLQAAGPGFYENDWRKKQFLL